MSQKCACLQNDFNLHISHTDCTRMVVEDQSEWMSVEGYEKPDIIPVKVTNLSTGHELSQEIYTKQRTLLSLGGSSQPSSCIPDGIYCFECVNCGSNYRINRPYLCNVQCKVDELLAKAKTQDDKDVVTKLQLMIDSIVIDTRIGKIQKASETFKLLNKRLIHLTCHSCGCK